MAYDAFMAAASAAEMRDVLAGRAVLEVRPLFGLDLLLRFGPRKAPAWAVLAGEPRAAFFGGAGEWPGLSAEAASNWPTAASLQAFARVLEVRLVGRVVEAARAYPWERTIEMVFTPREGLRGDGEPCSLVHEAAPKPAKTILLRGNRDIVIRWPGESHASGVEMARLGPGRPYSPPIALWEKSPAGFVTDKEALADALRAAAAARWDEGLERPDPLWRLLLEVVPALGPTLAREVARRVDGAGDPPGVCPLAHLDPPFIDSAHGHLAELVSLYTTGEWDPCLVLPGKGPSVPRDVAVFGVRPGQGLAVDRDKSPGQVLSVWHGLHRFDTARENLAARLQRSLRQALSRAERKVERQTADMDRVGPADSLRLKGELLLAHLHEIGPGQAEVTLDDFEGGAIAIALDPRLSPARNAQLYFHRYRKAQRTASYEAHRSKSLRELAWLKDAAFDLERHRDQWASEAPGGEGGTGDPGDHVEISAVAVAPRTAADLWATARDLADELVTLGDLEDALAEAGILPATRSATSAGQEGVHSGAGRSAGRRPPEPRRFITADGLTVLAGRSARQNEALALKMAQSRDVWLHARGCPGSHVLLRLTPGMTVDSVPVSSLLQAAALAAHLSKARGGGKVAVDYTEARHLRRPRGAPPGLILYDPHQTLVVDTGSVGLPRTDESAREG
jgi:hypothetical protein